MSSKIENLHLKLHGFIVGMRKKKVKVLLPDEHCLEKDDEEFDEMNKLMDVIGGPGTRRQLWQWNDLAELMNDSPDSEDSPWAEHTLGFQSDDDGLYDEYESEHQFPWNEVIKFEERSLANKDVTEDESDDELRGLVKKLKTKTKEKMEWNGLKGKDCIKPRLEKYGLTELLATAESIQEFGAYNVLRTIFIPLFKKAGIMGGEDAKLIQMVREIVPDGSLQHIQKFSTGTFANVLINLGTIAGKMCGLLSITAEEVHKLSNLIVNFQRKVAVLEPPPTITLFLDTAKELFDAEEATKMISKFFAPCKSPDLGPPAPGAPTSSTKPPCNPKPEPQPFDVPDSEKGTPEERGELKTPLSPDSDMIKN